MTRLWAFSDGPPLSTCETMEPHHHTKAQLSPSPYKISVSRNSYTTNENLKVTISGLGSKKFNGFILQARGMNSSVAWPVGKFTEIPEEGVRWKFPFPIQLKDLVPVVRKVDSAIHWIAQLVVVILNRWIAIYSVDSAIQLSNNRGLDLVPRKMVKFNQGLSQTLSKGLVSTKSSLQNTVKSLTQETEMVTQHVTLSIKYKNGTKF